jgi:phage baseplate assembly protein W
MASVLDQQRAFLGVGWAFPPQAAPTGEIAVAAYEEDVRQAIRIILGTTPGERVMRPTFGVGLRDLVFEPLNTTTMALAKHRVEVALATWEPRIDVRDVRVEAIREHSRMDIMVSYLVRSTNTFYNLVYPFYLLEGGER